MRTTQRATELSMFHLKRRREHLCSSDVPAILGVSPWSGPLDVWMDKMIPSENRILSKHESPAMYLGRLIEPLIVDWAADQLSLGRFRRNVWRCWTKDGVFAATLDAAGRDPQNNYVIVEAKSAGLASWKGTSGWGDGCEGRKGIPVWVLAQCMHQMLVTDVRQMYVAALVAGKGLQLYRVEATDKQVYRLYDYCRDWWNRYVMKRQAPEGIAVQRWWLRDVFVESFREHPVHIGDARAQRIAELHQRIAQLKQELREAEAERDSLMAPVIARMVEKKTDTAWAPLGPRHELTLLIKHSIVERKGYTVQPTRYGRTTIRLVQPDEVQFRDDPEPDPKTLEQAGLSE